MWGIDTMFDNATIFAFGNLSPSEQIGAQAAIDPRRFNRVRA